MKKVLAIALVMALLCIISVGGTLSYFTDTEGEVNTMTVGQVLITQNEKVRGGSDFVDNVNLLPVTNTDKSSVTIGAGTYDMLDTQYNAVDKIVTVTVDAGSQNAYIRTLVAFELMKIGSEWVNPLEFSIDETGAKVTTDKAIYMNAAETFTKLSEDIEVNGVHYVVYEYIYAGEYAAGTTTAPSLLQVYMDSDVGNKFFAAIGNDNYSILVLSQAVQSQGFADAKAAFDAAFPVNAANLAAWFNTVVPTP